MRADIVLIGLVGLTKDMLWSDSDSLIFIREGTQTDCKIHTSEMIINVLC
jgi:hypothetical protein